MDTLDSNSITMQENNTPMDPMNLAYMNYIRLMLQSVGSWPGDAIQNRPQRRSYYLIYLRFQASMALVGELIYIFNRFHGLSFFDLGDVFVTFALSILVWFRNIISIFDSYGAIFRDFVTKFHLIHFKHKGEYSEQVYHKTNQISHYFTVFVIGLCMSGCISFSVAPIYSNYKLGLFREDRPENITMEFAVHYEFPGFKQEDHFYISTILNMFMSYLCAFIICTMDLLLCLMVFQIIGHIRTLINTLRSFPKPRKLKELQEYRRRCDDGIIMVEITQHFNDEENETIRNIIKECTKHHLFISNFTDSISSFFGPVLALNYLYHLVGLSLLLVECMQGKDALMRYGPLTLMTLAQLSQLSVTFEVVGSESEKLTDEVYYVPWESMSVSNQKSMAFLLQRVQTPVRVTAMGMTPVGVTTMGAILKTTFSYCAFLRSLDA